MGEELGQMLRLENPWRHRLVEAGEVLFLLG
jgi:hypothetical protein